ncbi:hypothetical protein JJC03_07810 [Flavobacterium oreochromis]|uniref:hypothetical protein n=1 Tax=Flavobacterium oreochromis TaxID=2906078 RepID=UPI001CE4DCC1|nr:hypothetical protein [Flavobacterium oreochromis]QYS87679.1 hypothetical protein JJC03_07810 [Flavobacterium oreochromis]
MYTRYHFQKKNGNPIIDAQYTSWISSGIGGKAKAMLLQQMRSKGIIHYRECYMPDIAYVQYRTKNPADGVKKGEVKGLLQLEPGLFMSLTNLMQLLKEILMVITYLKDSSIYSFIKQV